MNEDFSVTQTTNNFVPIVSILISLNLLIEPSFLLQPTHTHDILRHKFFIAQNAHLLMIFYGLGKATQEIMGIA